VQQVQDGAWARPLPQEQAQLQVRSSHHQGPREGEEEEVLFALTTTTNKSWIANSGASSNFTYECSVLHNFVPLPGDKYVYLSDNT
jgi:hypothetical protein